MADQQKSTFDPLASWRNWLSDAETRWNSFFNQMMGTDQFSRVMSRFTELSLNMQKRMAEAMGQYFSALNLPTRTDVISQGERLSSIEERLTSIEASLARLSGAGEAPDRASIPKQRPPRTKQPQLKREGSR
jgi:polyhydroxyalkanoic acid synthase PhaR subunit